MGTGCIDLVEKTKANTLYFESPVTRLGLFFSCMILIGGLKLLLYVPMLKELTWDLQYLFLLLRHFFTGIIFSEGSYSAQLRQFTTT